MAETRKTRNSVAKVTHLDPSGADASLADGNVAVVHWSFANGTVRDITLADFPESVRNAFTVHGATQKLRDEYAGAENVDAAVEAFDTLYERLREGIWAERGQTGPRIDDLVTAATAVAVDNGLPASVEDNIRAMLVEKDAEGKLTAGAKAARKAANDDPVITARLRKLQAEKAAERAKAAAKAAKVAPAGTSFLSQFSN